MNWEFATSELIDVEPLKKDPIFTAEARYVAVLSRKQLILFAVCDVNFSDLAHVFVGAPEPNLAIINRAILRTEHHKQVNLVN